MLLASGSSAGDLITVVIVGLLIARLRRRLAHVFFEVLAYLNDPRTDGKRWKRDHVSTEPFLAGFFGLAGVAFVLEAGLDALGVISL